MFWVIFPEQCWKSVLLICCIVWPLPKIIFSGLPASRQLLRNKRTIPVTNIAELVEYVLLPHNHEVTKPPGLNTFLVGLAELGIDKGLIKNKKLWGDLIEKEKGYQNVENTITRVIMRRVHRILKIRRRRRKWLLRMALKLKAPRRATTTLKMLVRKQKVVALKSPPPSTLNVPVNIARTLMCTGYWSWNVLNAFGTITTRLPYMRSPDSWGEKEGFRRCQIL